MTISTLNHSVKNLIDTVTKTVQNKLGQPSTAADDEKEITLPIVFDMICPWLVECDRAASTQNGPNDMRAVGLGICAVLYLHDVQIPLSDLSHITISIKNQAISTMSLRDLQVFVGNLQLQFMSLYTWHSNRFHAHVDIASIALHVMKRIGFWTCNEFEAECADSHLKELSDVNGGYLQVRFEEVECLLDVIHTLLGTHRLLVNAKGIEAAHNIELFPHHREASTETWWEISIVTDCPIGSIIQYKNKFRALFHSVSQVIYFHYPSYSRQRQIPLEEVTSISQISMVEEGDEGGLAKATKHMLDCQINILPLLLQVEPDATLLFEHTGAGHRPTLAKNAWNWVIMGRFVLLIDRHMNVYTANDLRSLISVIKGVGVAI